MRKTAFAVLLAVAASAPAGAYSPVGYPGSSWGYAGREFNGISGNGTMGFVQQGVDWAELPGGARAGTFAGWSWRSRRLNSRYYDSHGPYAGAQVSRGGLAAGAEFAAQRYPLLGRTTRDLVLFGTWYLRRDLAPWTGRPGWGERRALGVPLSTWGRLEQDFNGIEGFGGQGWIEQGIDWARLPGGVVLDTFAAFRWMQRSRNERYFDQFGPAVGVHLVRGPFDLDLEYAWRRYPRLGSSEDGPQLLLTWYLDWDLARARR